MDRDDTHRRVLGALLPGSFLVAVGFGSSFLWDWIYLPDVPLHHGPGAFVELGIAGLIGAAWGLLAAWPRRTWAGVFLNGAVVGLLAFLLELYNLIRYPHARGFDLAIQLMGPPLAAALLSMALAGLWRAVLKLIQRALGRWQQAQILIASLAVLLVIGLGVALTWPLDQLDEALVSRRTPLRKVHRYGQVQGWENYALELEFVDSSYAVVSVYTSDGEVLTCTTSPWEGLTIGDIIAQDVTCRP